DGLFGRQLSNDDFVLRSRDLHPLAVAKAGGGGDIDGKADREILPPTSDHGARHGVSSSEIFLAYPRSRVQKEGGLFSALEKNRPTLNGVASGWNHWRLTLNRR